MAGASTWFVMIPPAYASQSDAEKELVDFRVQYPAGSQAWKDANAGRVLSAAESGEGQQLVKWKGPFATEAQAQAAQAPRQQSPNPGNDLLNAAQTSTSGPVSGLNAIGSFFTTLTSATLWLRVVKVMAGGVLLIAGLLKMTSLDQKALGVAGAAAGRLPGV